MFEKAYCQYRLNLPQDAIKTLNSAASLSLKLKELKAQILYRLERYLVTGTGVNAFLVTYSVRL
jgi:signal recognition particle subunit SRP72